MSILAAVDGEGVPDTVVSVGYDLASAYEEELIVLHVMPQERFEERRKASTENSKGTVLAPEVDYGVSHSTESGTNSPSDRDAHTIDQDAKPNAEAVARDVVRGTLDDYSNVSFQGRVGDPAQEIIDEGERQDARHVVVGGKHRSPVGKAVLGSITQSVLLGTDRPVTKVEIS